MLTENDTEHPTALYSTRCRRRFGAGAIIRCIETNRFLLGFRSLHVEQPHTWATFGGTMNISDSSPYCTAVREVIEETEMDGSKILGHQKLSVYKDPKNGFTYYNYIIETKEEFNPIVNWENEKAGWFLLNKFPEPLHFGVTSLLNSSEFKNYVSSCWKKPF